MLGDILGVEQLESTGDQSRHQMHQRHFRSVADAVKHALAEKGAAETDAIEPAGEIAVLPDLDAVAMAELVQAEIEVADALLIQVSSRPSCGAAHPAMTALKAVLAVTVKASERTVRARREAMRKPSSGITPRISGSTQNSVGSSALSAIGKIPQA